MWENLEGQDNITKHNYFYEDAVEDFSQPMALTQVSFIAESMLPWSTLCWNRASTAFSNPMMLYIRLTVAADNRGLIDGEYDQPCISSYGAGDWIDDPGMIEVEG
ncbi:hypothetical protein ZIOFF_047294 [Zingiber officinale]|uniref:Uncharacterized protein n=1 Tax=Zingiber officinale TaxID=94328 RepID=A0A8J5FUP3_ZINOF|nr:hypothetical protein ZIOFF_047294 [Zingiber officinale]